ncbi:MAG TPA: tryptophan 2,3-dioxygenase family protein [Mycobacteriales bacterium]|nr:tryptophan 2,3-dioxygenase family protein [Mycobacteriales bacterium]
MNDGAVTYQSYLHIPELLALQDPPRAHDELLFIVAHQSHELWFKLVLHELTAVRDRMLADDCRHAMHPIKRAITILHVLTAQWDVLDTMRPAGYLEFRHELGTGSGFQSVQFREIEFLCGRKDPSYLDNDWLSAAERDDLTRRLTEPSLAEAMRTLFAARGVRDVPALLAEQTAQPDLSDLCDALVDLEVAFGMWRARHVLMVERQIGHKPGTGGSSGTEYLRSTTTIRFFPELWEARTEL